MSLLATRPDLMGGVAMALVEELAPLVAHDNDALAKDVLGALLASRSFCLGCRLLTGLFVKGFCASSPIRTITRASRARRRSSCRTR